METPPPEVLALVIADQIYQDRDSGKLFVRVRKMSDKAKVTVRIYYTFPPKGMETSPNQVTWEEVQKYLSGKPLRRGPERQGGKDAGGGSEKADPRPDADKPSGPGSP